MPLLTCEFDGGAVREWHATSDGIECRWNRDYAPTLFVDGPAETLATLEGRLRSDPKVTGTAVERWFTDLGDRERSSVLRVDCERIGEVRHLAREIRSVHEDEYAHPGRLRLYNVDLAPQFRYCVETDTPPVPERDLEVLDLDIPETALRDGDLTALAADGERLGGGPAAVLDALQERLDERDPDVVRCSTAEIVPLCHDRAADLGQDFSLGRAPGYERLAGASTFESYGRVGHSPARYRVPGRAIVDRSNSFLLGESGIPGLLDLVERSWRPLQETAWGSIGTILTAIQIRRALARDVLVPWNKWEPEAFKSVETLHAGDRGGFTFAPEVGFHENVVEVDFGSLYPNIMVEHNISPETIRCDCHDREDVPGLGYSICDRDGFVPDVLEPIIDDRAAIKEEIRRTDDSERAETLEARSAALKWILVSCFGYQGYRNAKFGRIECHESINAFAREILLDAKEILEDGGWRVVHGIVDSLWLQPVEGRDRTPIRELCTQISEEMSIPLELEDRFEWVCFVPRRDGDAGTLTKYFGKVATREEYVTKGIDAVQRQTPQFIEDLQRELIRTLDRTRSAEPVADRLQRGLGRIRGGDVDPAELVVRTRASKRREDYEQHTQTVAAVERARAQGLARGPGQDVEYVVVDDSRRSTGRVRLAHEEPASYDSDFYTTLAMRAGETVLSPLGWDRERLRRHLRETTLQTLGSYR